MDDFDKTFRNAQRHQTTRIIIICATALAASYWILPAIIAAMKH